MNFATRFLFTGLSFALSSTGFAQSFEQNARNLNPRFQHLTYRDGLSALDAHPPLKDKRGFLWIKSSDGLNRYDGKRVTVFRNVPGDSTSLTGNWIDGITLDSSGVLWVATSNGLCMFDEQRDRFVRFTNEATASFPPRQQLVTASLYLSDDSTLWMGTMPGLASFNIRTRTFTNYPYDSHPLATRRDATTFLNDGTGGLWFGTLYGLWRFDRITQRFDHYVVEQPGWDIPRKQSENSITSLYRDRSGTIWVTTWGGGLRTFDFNSRRYTARYLYQRPTSQQGTHNVVVGVDEQITDQGDTLMWVATKSGLALFDRPSGKFHLYTHDPADNGSVLSNLTTGVIHDENGVVWVGTESGMSRFDARRQFVKRFEFSPGMAFQEFWNVTAFAQDVSDKNAYWMCTAQGDLFQWNRADNSYRRVNLPRHDLLSLMCLGNRQLLLGTSSGLLLYDPASNLARRLITNDTRLNGASVRTVIRDEADSYWVLTYDAEMFHFDMRANNAYPILADGKEIHATGIVHEAGDIYWIGTPTLGLLRYDKRNKTVVPARPLPGRRDESELNAIGGLTIDKRKNLWIAGVGLVRYDIASGTFTTYDHRHGLKNQIIYNVYCDSAGAVWGRTRLGLFRFDPERERFAVFTRENGLATEFLDWPARMFTMPDGEVFITSRERFFNYFHPRSVPFNSRPPVIRIAAFSVAERPSPIPLDGDGYAPIVLTHKSNQFRCEFVALDYTDPRENQYAYMLDGFDSEWRNIGTRNSAAFTHLEPGGYVLRVKASNNDGVWNEAGISIPITIQPAYWQTVWFKAVVVLFILAGLYALYRYRLMKALEVERTRNRIARDLHDEISGTLSGITFFAEAIRRQQDGSFSNASSRFLEKISESAASVQDGLADIIWSINPEHDDLERLLVKCRRHASDMFDAAGIRHSVDIPAFSLPQAVSMDRRRNFWMLYKEMVTNIVKHSQCKEASIRFSIMSHRLSITVEDNGKGFDASTQSDRNGIKNIRSRADALGATISLITDHGKGTRWIIEFAI